MVSYPSFFRRSGIQPGLKPAVPGMIVFALKMIKTYLEQSVNEKIIFFFLSSLINGFANKQAPDIVD
jgi:hypothetical protein